MSDEFKEYLELAVNLDYYDSSGGSAPAEAADVIRDLIGKIQKLQAKCDEWVSVEDRLPEASKEVLMFIYEIYALGYIDANGEWWNDGDEKENSGSVTHWKSLPPPPSDKGAKDE